MAAAEAGHVGCARLLIAASSPAEIQLSLLAAAKSGRADCVKLLIPAANPKSSGSLALENAARYGREDCVRLLIPVSDPLLNCQGALAAALHNGHLRVAMLLIEREPLLLADASLPSVLAQAIALGHSQLAPLLSAVIDKAELSSINVASGNLRAQIPRSRRL